METNYENEFRELVDAGADPTQLAGEARHDLAVFCDEHWADLTPRVKSAYKYMWEGIYSWFQHEEEDGFPVPYARRAYASCKNDLADLKFFEGMSELDVARHELQTKEPAFVPQRTIDVVQELDPKSDLLTPQFFAEREKGPSPEMEAQGQTYADSFYEDIMALEKEVLEWRSHTQAERLADRIFERYSEKLLWELDAHLEDSITEELAETNSGPRSQNGISMIDGYSDHWQQARADALEPVWDAIESTLPKARSNLAKHICTIQSGPEH